MPIFKEVSVETEAWQVGFRERQKDRMSEVMAIRQSIVDLFDSEPGETLTNKEILEWLLRKGFKVNSRQISPKMKMMPNLFLEIRVNGKSIWQRMYCAICQRPLELGNEYSLNPEMKIGGHSVCIEFVSKMHEQHKQQIFSLKHENDMLREYGNSVDEDIKRLRSMIVFPSENQNTGRRIEL